MAHPVAVEPRSTTAAVSDVLAAIAVVWTLYALGNEGGFDLSDWWRAAIALAAAVPAAAGELRRLPRWVGPALGGLGLFGLAALATAQFRTDFVAPTLTYATLPVMALAVSRLWRRPWGPAVIGGALVVSLAQAWWDGFLGWSGSLLSPTISDRWLSLAWHNQSATLMAAGGLFLSGVALTMASARVAVAATLGAGTFFAAMWLGGSRGAVTATVLGIAVLAATAPKLLRLTGIAAASVLMLFVFSQVLPAAETVSQPLSERDISATESFSHRVDHARAALGMFLDRPATGYGPGAYRLGSIPFSDPEINPTAYAHNEYVELFAEGGVGFGLAGMVLLAGVGAAAVGAARRRVEGSDLRSALDAGAPAVAIMLGIHSAFDFDWLFPILGVVLAVAAGVIISRLQHRGSSPLWLAPLGLMLAIGLLAGWVELNGEGPAPWNVAGARSQAAAFIDEGDYAAAEDEARRGLGWNPGDRPLETLRIAAGYGLGTSDAAAVAGSVDLEASGFLSANLAGAFLVDHGECSAARTLLTDAIDGYRDFTDWPQLRSLEIEGRRLLALSDQKLAAGACQ